MTANIIEFILFSLPFLYLFGRRNKHTKGELFVFSLLILSFSSRPFLKIIYEIPPVKNPGSIALRTQAIIFGIIFLILFFFLYKNLFLKHRFKTVNLFLYERIIILLAFFNLIWLVVGVLMKNDPGYIVSDTYKFFIFPVVYFSIIKIIKNENIKNVLNTFYRIVIIVLIVSLGEQIFQLFSPGFLEVGTAGATTVLPISLLFFFSTENKNIFWNFPKNKTLFLLILALSSIIFSLSRGEWVAASVGLTVAFIFIVFKKMLFFLIKSLPLIFITVIVILLLSTFTIEPVDKITNQLKAKFIATKADVESTMDVLSSKKQATLSFDVKIAEGIDSLSHMKERGSFLNYIIGMGNGAQYKIQTTKSTRYISSKGEYFKHQIHNIFVAIFFRRGILGLSFVLLLFSVMMLTYFKAWSYCKDQRRIIFGATLITFLMILVKQLSVYSFFFNIYFIIFLGLIGVLLRSSPQQYENSN